MLISDVSVRRPVFAAVISLMLVIIGLMSLRSLPTREYPDIDPPIVSVSMDYRGASAEVVEKKITQQLEDAVAGIEGIDFMTSIRPTVSPAETWSQAGTSCTAASSKRWNAPCPWARGGGDRP